MVKSHNNRIYFLTIIFTIITLIHVAYATLTLRGLYEDGAFYAVSLLNNLAADKYIIAQDIYHPRFMSMFVLQLPLWILNVLHLNEKRLLLTLFSFFQFALPPLILYWNYLLTKRTGKTHIFFFHLFTYCAVILPFSIFSVVESITGFGTHFILWNYLVGDIKYKKRDIVGIILALVFLFGTYEYVIFIGTLFFLFHFAYVFKSTELKSKIIKTVIGITSLAAVIYNVTFMLKVDGESGEIKRFIGEATDWLPHIFELCSLYSVITIILLLIFAFKKTRFNTMTLVIITLIYLAAGIKLFLNPFQSVYPMWEQHLRAMPCVLLPVIFIVLKLIDNTTNKEKYINLTTIVFLCGIMQTAHQIVNTYWWQKNTEYLKTELAQENSLLYLPSEHEAISGFHEENLRRYIWHGVYPATSILFSNEYKQKTLLMIYDVPEDEGNPTGREFLYLTREGKLSIPFGAELNLKNKYWDLTDCANAVDKYNKENNINTYGNE